MSTPKPRLPNKADPLQSVVFGAIGIASVFGLWTWLNLTADEVGALGGFLIMVIAGVRSWWRMRHNAKARREEEAEPPPSEIDTEDPEDEGDRFDTPPRPEVGPDGRPYREG